MAYNSEANMDLIVIFFSAYVVFSVRYARRNLVTTCLANTLVNLLYKFSAKVQ